MKLNIHEFLTELEYLKDEADEQRFQMEQAKRLSAR